MAWLGKATHDHWGAWLAVRGEGSAGSSGELGSWAAHVGHVLRNRDLWAPLWVWSDWGEQQSLGRSWL